MSEPMFPSATGAVAAAAPEPAATGGSRKAVFAVGGAVAALAVGAGAFFLLTGSGGSSDTAAPAPAPRVAAPAPAPSASAAAKPTTIIRTTVVTSRDPFAVLFPAPAPSTAAPAPAPAAPAAQGPVAAPTVKITLSVSGINAAKQTATVTVDGVAYKSQSVGSTFAKSFMLYSVFNAQCVGVLFGDQSVPLCTGQTQTVSP